MENLLITKNMDAVYRRKQAKMSLPKAKPKQKLLLITAMDHRVDPESIFGLDPGDILTIRNAGVQVTEDVIRSVMTAMLFHDIKYIIVLGNTNNLLADSKAFQSGYAKFFRNLPKYSRYATILNTREKASKFFFLHTNVVENVFLQMENLKFLQNIQPGLVITGMLYNIDNGHVYDLSELRELRKILFSNPDESLKDIIPVRYDDFVVEKAKEKQVALGGSTFKPKEMKMTVATGFKDTEEPPGMPDLDLMSDLPAPIELQDIPDLSFPDDGTNKQLQEMMDSTKKGFDIAFDAMQESMKKATNVHVFVPKIRAPKIRIPKVLIPGSKSKKQEEKSTGD